MASLEDLTVLIYHEAQQPGSMLCAQHALNSLLQGHYFTAPDLSEIARQLDELEDNYNQDHRLATTSNNMDDTGFFSVQVLENALQVWGLNLIRWRGEEMRPFQEHPHTQLAFILNHEQHWYTLRRFGPASSDFRNDPGHGHWFNLNSFFSKPEWVGKLYLSMFLHQAESEGYSVFAVTQTDESIPLALPRTDADHLAATLPEPGSASYSAAGTTSTRDIENLEDDDWELQAALQASLQHADDDSPRRGTPPHPIPFSLPSTAIGGTGSFSSAEPPGMAESEFGAASRRMLQRMQAEQEYAQRELWNSNPRPAGDDDDEILRRVLVESEVIANSDTTRRSTTEEVEVDSSTDTPTRQSDYTGIISSVSERNYDDEDAELQAALKASLEDVPASWSVSTSVPTVTGSSENSTDASTLPVTRLTSSSVTSEDADDLDTEPSGPSEAVDIEEVRKRRMARFGS